MDESGLVAGSAVFVLFMVAFFIGCGFGARALMRGKGRSGAAGFCLGFFLGLIGVLIAALLSSTPEQQAQRMRLQMQFMGIAPPPGGLGAPPQSAVPAPMLAGQSTAQWAGDPFRRHELRYFDGSNWTSQVSDAGVVGTDIPAATPSPPAAPPPSAAPPPPPTSPAPPPAMPLSAPPRSLPAVPLVPVPAAPDGWAPAVSASANDVEVTRQRPRAGVERQLRSSSGEVISLPGPVVIGRAPTRPSHVPSAALRVVADTTSSVSRTQCMVSPIDGELWLEDLGSSNGTDVVRDDRTTTLAAGERMQLAPGDRVELGDTWLDVV